MQAEGNELQDQLEKETIDIEKPTKLSQVIAFFFGEQHIRHYTETVPRYTEKKLAELGEKIKYHGMSKWQVAFDKASSFANSCAKIARAGCLAIANGSISAYKWSRDRVMSFKSKPEGVVEVGTPVADDTDKDILKEAPTAISESSISDTDSSTNPIAAIVLMQAGADKGTIGMNGDDFAEPFETVRSDKECSEEIPYLELLCQWHQTMNDRDITYPSYSNTCAEDVREQSYHVINSDHQGMGY